MSQDGSRSGDVARLPAEGGVERPPRGHGGVLRPLGMTVTHYSCLELLAQRPGLSNSELARGAFVTRQSMNVLLQALERDGYVTRPARGARREGLPTRLTPRGRRSLEKATVAVRSVEIRMLGGMTQDERSTAFHPLNPAPVPTPHPRRRPCPGVRPPRASPVDQEVYVRNRVSRDTNLLISLGKGGGGGGWGGGGAVQDCGGSVGGGSGGTWGSARTCGGRLVGVHLPVAGDPVHPQRVDGQRAVRVDAQSQE